MKYERVILIIVLAAVWGGFLDGPLSVLNDLVWNLLDLAHSTLTASHTPLIMPALGR